MCSRKHQSRSKMVESASSNCTDTGPSAMACATMVLKRRSASTSWQEVSGLSGLSGEQKIKNERAIFFVRGKKNCQENSFYYCPKSKNKKRTKLFHVLIKLSSCRAVPLTPRTCCVSVHIFNNLMPRASSLDCSHCFASDLSMA